MLDHVIFSKGGVGDKTSSLRGELGHAISPRGEKHNKTVHQGCSGDELIQSTSEGAGNGACNSHKGT